MLYETEHADIRILYVPGISEIHIHTGTGIFRGSEIQEIVACSLIINILLIASDARHYIVAVLERVAHNLGVSAW